MTRKEFEEKNQKVVEELSEKLKDGLLSITSSDKYKDYLNAMSKFHSYSYSNVMLILLQCPKATYVTGYKSWATNFNRYVRKGEKGITIYAPRRKKYYKVVDKVDEDGKVVLSKDGNKVKIKEETEYIYYRAVSVFDISQTDGDELPSVVTELGDDVSINVDSFIRALHELSPLPIKYIQRSDIGGSYGKCSSDAIYVAHDVSPVQQIKTTIHEIAHAWLKHISKHETTTKNSREVEAESIAYIVCNHYDIDTSSYSFGYIVEWSTSEKLSEFKQSLSTIQKAASEIISRIDDYILSNGLAIKGV